MSLREENAADVDVETTITPYDLPPTAKVLRHGGRYEIEDSQRIPSLPELIRSLAAVDVDFEDPVIAGLVPEHDVMRFCVQHGIRLEETLRLLRREEPYESFIKKGLLQSVYLNLLMYEEGDPVLSEVGVPLPVAELHSPLVFGCESAYEVAAERSREAGLRVEVRGVGAGGGVGARLNFRDRLWTEAE